jgi:lysozyme
MRTAIAGLVACAGIACGAGVGCGSDSSSGSGATCTQSSPLTRVCPADAGAKVLGVDVSKYEATISWTQVKAAGIAFAFARISDGTANPDAYFAANWKGMKAQGIVRGAYQFFRASVDPTAQANLVVTSLQQAGGLQAGDLPVVMDIETADGQTESTIESNMRTWLGVVAAQTRLTPIIYTSAGTYPVTTAAFASYPLWVANYGATCPSMPTGWSQWKFWQTSSTGTVSGISGAVDLDQYNGTLADLMNFGAGAGSDAGTPGASDAGPTDASMSGNAQGPAPGTDAGMTNIASAGGSDDAGAAMGSAGSGLRADASTTPCHP